MATTEDYDPPLFQTPLVNQFNHHVDSEDKEFIDAKAFLLQSSTVTGINLYDHLSNILNKVLEERPCNAVDILEELSKLEKRNRYNVKSDGIIDKPDLTTEVALAEIQRRLFSKRGGDTAQEEEEEEEEEEDDEDDENSPLPDLMQLCYHFEQAGVGLNREEMVRIWLALKALSKQHQFTMIRFWGKIFGMEQNYIVAEVQFEEGEDPEEDDDEADDEQEEEESAKDKLGDDEEEGEEEEEEDKLPQIKFKPPPVVPKEDKGTGVNKMTYYVCTEPGKPWVKLPSVTPAQISVARKIKKFFTGRLDAPIISYPPFEGREAHYLRAQIARISAGTQISPRGYYQFDEDEDEPEEGEIRENVVINGEYEPLAVAELIDPSLENWVHHTLHILPQGRVKWWNPKDAEGEGEEEEAEDEEDKEEPEELEPEVGPPLLTPLSEDADLNGQPAWTTRISSKLMRKYAVAVIHSCLWPGAHAFATDKTFENIYIGWGHKYSADNFSPTLPPELQTEFPSGPEITEAKDPTVAEEAAHKAAKAAREEGEEEEEDDEDDDDDAGDDDDGDED